MNLEKKLAKLKKIISKMGSILVAFSGGVDSTFLLKIAATALPKDKILAVTASSPTYPTEELRFSKDMAKALGLRHKIIKTDELKDKRFISNPFNRCYFCKKGLFRKLKAMAKTHRINFVVDASNCSDRKDYRPGNQAKQELNVRSPLQEAGLRKEDIRKASKRLGLVTWNKPSLACLASRIAYHSPISLPVLSRINRAERFLKQLGFRQVRLRHYNGLCRIEVFKDDIDALLKQRDLVVKKIKGLGYRYITLDLEGYRTGSLNEVMKR